MSRNRTVARLRNANVLLSAALAIVLAPPGSFRVLMLGNSHTLNHNVAGMLQELLNSDGSPVKATVEVRSGGHLEDISKQPDILRQLRDRYQVVVMQGAMVSSSHRYTYRQDGAIAMAQAAKRAGAQVLLFSEWPRRGWDETEYTEAVYRGIAKAGGGEVVPVGRAWDRWLRANPSAELWSGDGNHSAPAGAFLAAVTIYHWIRGDRSPGFAPPGVSQAAAKQARRFARETYLKR